MAVLIFLAAGLPTGLEQADLEVEALEAAEVLVAVRMMEMR